MKIKVTLISSLMLAVLSLPVLAETKADPVSLTVNKEPVNDMLFRTYYRLQAQKDRSLLNPDNTKARGAVMNQLVNIMLLADAGEKNKLDADPIIAEKLRITRYEILAQAEIARVLGENPISDEQIKQAYEKQYTQAPEKEFRIRHIQAKTKEDLADAEKALNDGKPFAEVASKYSIDSSKSSGGDLGWLTINMLGDTLSKAASQLKVGEYSQTPVQSDFGWHILFLEDSRNLPKPPMTEVYETIKTSLKRKVMSDYMTGLRDSADIVYTGVKKEDLPAIKSK